MKANPEPRIISLLAEMGSSFDIASLGELESVLAAGGAPSNISFGNTAKKEKDIRQAHEWGVSLFVADSLPEVKKIAQCAPKSKVFVRLVTDPAECDWPLCHKFGAGVEETITLLLECQKLGLQAYGLSFHVGSQCYEVAAWERALAKAKLVFRSMRSRGIELTMLNTGGGIPVQHIKKIPEISEICACINRCLDDLREEFPQLIVGMEPGRSLVGDSAVLCSEVILRSKKADREWIYLDTGIYHGLSETIMGFSYEIIVPGKTGPLQEFTLAGPTCDSIDVIYHRVLLPSDVEIGDRLLFLNAGAYTNACACCFNGIPPPRIHYLF